MRYFVLLFFCLTKFLLFTGVNAQNRCDAIETVIINSVDEVLDNRSPLDTIGHPNVPKGWGVKKVDPPKAVEDKSKKRLLCVIYTLAIISGLAIIIVGIVMSRRNRRLVHNANPAN